MNKSKTEFTMFGSQQQLAKLVTSSIDVNETLIKRTSSIRYRGANLDEQITLCAM